MFWKQVFNKAKETLLFWDLGPALGEGTCQVAELVGPPNLFLVGHSAVQSGTQHCQQNRLRRVQQKHLRGQEVWGRGPGVGGRIHCECDFVPFVLNTEKDDGGNFALLDLALQRAGQHPPSLSLPSPFGDQAVGI